MNANKRAFSGKGFKNNVFCRAVKAAEWAVKYRGSFDDAENRAAWVVANAYRYDFNNYNSKVDSFVWDFAYKAAQVAFHRWQAAGEETEVTPVWAGFGCCKW